MRYYIVNKKEHTVYDNVDEVPGNVDYLYDNFYGDKELSIWAYLPNPIERRSNTYEFSKYIGEKYNIPIRYKPLNPGQKFDYMSQEEFITNWSSCAFHFNLDPIDYFPGNQCPVVAATGTINIGGVNDYHHILFPETATCDLTILENKVNEYINDKEKYFVKLVEYPLMEFFSLLHRLRLSIQY